MRSFDHVLMKWLKANSQNWARKISIMLIANKLVTTKAFKYLYITTEI